MSLATYKAFDLGNFYFSRGMENYQRNDLICLAHIPFVVFQKIVSRWAEGEVNLNKVFTDEALTIAGVGQEPARFKIVELSLKAQTLLSSRTEIKDFDSDPNGFSALLTPDMNNRIANEPASMLQYEVNKIYGSVIENKAETAQNEAQKLMDQIKGLVPQRS